MPDFQRQLDILPPQAIVHNVTVIGLGGIGSWTAYVIRKMGFKNFALWDPDKLERHNLPSQHYENTALGEAKVDSLSLQLQAALDGERAEILDFETRFTAESELGEGIVISAVDNMQARRDIWEAVKKRRAFVPLFLDGRVGVEWNEESGKVGGEWLEIFTIVPSRLEDQEFYEENLFPDEEAAPLRCTAQAVAYLGPLIAGFMAGHLKKWLMKEPYIRHLLYDNLTNTFLGGKS